MTINPVRWRRHIWLNRLQTFSLLAVMCGFLALLGWLLWGGEGLLILLVVGVLLLTLRPLVTPFWIARLYGARSLIPEQAPQLYLIVLELARRAGLAGVPVLYYLPSAAVNAFTVGDRDDAVITLSDGLLRTLDKREIIGVLAHEISHIRSNDMRVMELANQISRLTFMLSVFGLLLLLISLPLWLLGQVAINGLAILLLILAPHLSALAQLGLSRTREYDADLNAAYLSGDPEGLAAALVKIERYQQGWLARLIFPVRQLPMPSLLRTHPPTEERVQRLLALRTTIDEVEPIRLTGGESLHSEEKGVLPKWHISRWWQ